MDRIKILDNETINLIAAGEVIERPASVVKELVENSIDAKSSEIIVNIESGGKKLIQVTDNGIGMSRNDALMSISKHATSKISGKDDLKNIRTLGFRGEALYSISSVSKMEIITGEEYDKPSTFLKIDFGKIVDVHDEQPRKGTLIKVMDLFENLPARRKFLKGDNQEFKYIEDFFVPYTLENESIGFKLIHNGKIVLDLPQVKDLKDRLAQIYSPEDALNMIQVSSSNGNLKISGIISKQNLNRKTRDHMFIFVNGRYVQANELNDAILEGYGSLLFHDRYPIVVIKIEIPPDEIDVNIHPSKIRIKFQDEYLIKKFVKETISNALKDLNLIPSERPNVNPVLEKMPEMLEPVQKNDFFQYSQATVQKKIEEHVPDLGGLKIIGQFAMTYIICESPDSLILIDQHAAHERIRTEKFLDDMNRKNFQKLISPVMVDLSSQDAEILRTYKEIFEEYGFSIDVYQRSVSVKSVPSIFSNEDIKDAILEGIDQIKSSNKGIDEERKFQIAALMACKGAIKANEKLSDKEMKSLIIDLMKCRNPYTCPHGRPTMIKLEIKEIEKMFKRRF
ncbi:MAG: DNA mismatch repair endonuclease MutL [Thermoplasmata archaeon]